MHSISSSSELQSALVKGTTGGPHRSCCPRPTALSDQCIAPTERLICSISNYDDTVPPVFERRRVVHIKPGLFPATSNRCSFGAASLGLRRTLQGLRNCTLHMGRRQTFGATLTGSRRDLPGLIPLCTHEATNKGVVKSFSSSHGLKPRLFQSSSRSDSSLRRPACLLARNPRQTLVRFCEGSKRERSALMLV